MSQVTNYTIPGSPLTMSGLASSLEDLFAAAASCNRGATAPSNPFEGMLWWDSTTNPEILKRYTAVGGWVSIVSVDITTGAMTISGYIANTLFDANTILAANSDNNPVVVTVAEDRILGRKTGGNITALTGAEVSTIIGGAALPWVLMSDVKTANDDGGNATALTDNPRTLNTITGSSGYSSWASLASSRFSLAVGTYFIDASAPAYSVQNHQIILQNYSTSTIVTMNGGTAAYGTAEYAASSYAQTRSFLKGLFTVSNAGHSYRILHFTDAGQSTNGLGMAANRGIEVYTTVHLVKHS